MEALDVLRPSPTLRQRALMQITDPFIHNALLAFDALSDRMKAEQSSSHGLKAGDVPPAMRLCGGSSAASGASILSSFLADRKFSWSISASTSRSYRIPSSCWDGCFFNDLLAHIYKGHGEGRFDEHHPCYVLCDEVQNFATTQVCDALDEGRGIGCHMVIAHQHLSQLADEDQSGYLLRSCMNDARTKMVFGGLDVEDLEAFAGNLMMQHYDPWRVKHIQKTPVFAPVESVRKVPTWNTSRAESQAVTESFSEADSSSHSVEHSISHGRSVADAVACTEGESASYTQGRIPVRRKVQNWVCQKLKAVRTPRARQ